MNKENTKLKQISKTHRSETFIHSGGRGTTPRQRFHIDASEQ